MEDLSTSLCFPEAERGAAAIVTDFRQDGNGLSRILVLDHGLNATRRGALSQRVIDIENYRTLRCAGVAVITREVKNTEARNSQALLLDLTELAAELEANAASTLYRFGASRAYDGIVSERLEALDESLVPGYDNEQPSTTATAPSADCGRLVGCGGIVLCCGVDR